MNDGFRLLENAFHCLPVHEIATHKLRWKVIGGHLVCRQDFFVLVHQQLHHPASQPSCRSGYYYHFPLRHLSLRLLPLSSWWMREILSQFHNALRILILDRAPPLRRPLGYSLILPCLL